MKAEERMKTGHYLIALTVITTFCFGCQKNSSVDLKPILNVANDIVIIEGINQYVYKMVLKASADSALLQEHIDTIDMAVVRYNETDRQFTFDYSYNHCNDSVVRAGTFTAEFTSGFLVPGSVTIISFNNYSEDGMAIFGTDSIVNISDSNGNKLVFQGFFRDGVVWKELQQNNSIQWSAACTFETNRSDLNYPGQVIIYQKGTTAGTSSNGYSFSGTLDTLVSTLNCPWIYSGLVHFSFNNPELQYGSIDFIIADNCKNHVNYNFAGTIYSRLISFQAQRN